MRYLNFFSELGFPTYPRFWISGGGIVEGITRGEEREYPGFGDGADGRMVVCQDAILGELDSHGGGLLVLSHDTCVSDDDE